MSIISKQTFNNDREVNLMSEPYDLFERPNVNNKISKLKIERN